MPWRLCANWNVFSADKGLGWELAPDFKKKYLQGADEIQLVRSGLDDTMRTAYQAISEEWHRRKDVTDLRTAAFIVSITRVADSYRAKGPLTRVAVCARPSDWPGAPALGGGTISAIARHSGYATRSNDNFRMTLFFQKGRFLQSIWPYCS